MAEGHIGPLNGGATVEFVAQADKRSYDNSQGYNSIVMGFRRAWDLRIEPAAWAVARPPVTRDQSSDFSVTVGVTRIPIRP